MSEQNLENKVRQLYKHFAEGNIPEVLATFHPDVVFERPGGSEIPFAGTFKGIEDVVKMFGIIQQSIRLKGFSPKKFCTNQDTVVVLGDDEAEVISTGKIYRSDWVQAFTFKEDKIIHVQVYMDTLSIANAFRP